MTDQTRITIGTTRRVGWLFAATLIVVLAAGSLTAQVLVSPTTVFLSDKSPTGRLILLNQSPHDQEITIAFSF